MTLISAILALGFLIFIHELGHFLVAKKAGVGVKVFSLGFGSRLFGFKKSETDYRLSAVPLGGYVRMVGEHPGEEVELGEEHKSFSHKPLLWRMAIVGAGPVSNLALAFVLYYLVLVVWGIPTLTTMVGQPLAGKPAAIGGVQKGDRVLAINGKPVKDWDEMVMAIQANGAKPMDMQVNRGGSERTLVVTPKEVTIKDMFGDSHRVYQVGIQASQERISREVTLGDALGQAAELTYNSGKLIFVSILKLVQRKVSMDNMGGPILIAQAASEAARHGLAPFLDLTALISVNLAVLNLLPIPALDGGHLFFFLIEAVRRKPVSVKIREKTQQVGMALLLMLMAFVFYNDIVRIVTGG